MPTKAELNAIIREQEHAIQQMREELHRLTQNQAQQDQQANAQPPPPQQQPIDFRPIINDLRQQLLEDIRREFQQIRLEERNDHMQTPNGVLPPAPLQQNGIQQPPPQQHQQQQQNAAPALYQKREILKPYTGKGSVVSPVGWINFFEFLLGKVSDQQRYRYFVDHLADDAQNWIVHQFGVLGKNPQWATVKQLFISHFSGSIVPPGVAASHTKFNMSGDIEKFFEKKCHLFELANTQLQDQIGFLTDGVEKESIREGLLIATIESLPQWLAKAKMLVDNFHMKQRARDNAKSQQSKFGSLGTANNSKKDVKKPPSSPCQNCLREKGIEVKHWHVDCPYYKPKYNKPNNASTNTKPSTSKTAQHVKVDQQEDSSDDQNSLN